MINERKNSPIFICGHPKAGTSLLTSLLDGHPAMVVYPEETLFFRRFLPAIEGKNAEEKLALADELLIHIFQWNQENPPEHQNDYPDRDYSGIDFDQVHEYLRDVIYRGGDSGGDILEAAVMGFGEASGLLTDETRYWVEKSPYNELYSEQIFQWWPGAKCIHVIRDPRDNYVSYKKKHPDWTVKVFARNWICSTKAGLENQHRFGKDRYYVLRFEDLLLNPEPETQKLANFLGLPWDDALLQPTRVGDSWSGNSMFAQTFRSISQDPIGRWKTNTPMKDLVIMQAIARRTMAAVGYLPEKVPLRTFNLEDKLKIIKEKLLSLLRPE
ncbi:MAG: sulfotransferase [Anaerolineaceae bacterium]|nr:sulfotransferase [Anaerolineaceae bacterium]